MVNSGSTLENPFDQGYYTSDFLSTLGFRSVGGNVKIARNATIIGLKNISIGSNVRIDGNVTITVLSGYLNLGNYIHIGAGCHISCGGGVTMDDFAGLSQGVRIYSGSDDYGGDFLTNPTVPDKYTRTNLAPVSLGRHVIIGSGTVILPGASVGEGSSVGALSLVTKPLDDWGVYFGQPARRLKSRSRKLLDLESQLLSEVKI